MSTDPDVCRCGSTLTEEPDDQYGTIWRCPAGHTYVDEGPTELEMVFNAMASVAIITALVTNPAAPAMLEQVKGAMRTATERPPTQS